MLAGHTGAAAALWLTDLPAWADVCLGGLILASLLDVGARHVLRLHPDAVVACTLPASQGPWHLRCRRGIAYHADLREDTWVHPRLILLNFQRRDGGRVTMVLASDSLDPHVLRRLRVRLRTRDAGGEPARPRVSGRVFGRRRDGPGR